MKNKKQIIIISVIGVIIAALVLALSFICFHNWADATCEAPMTCTRCGKTKGEMLQHEWVEATCIESKHCLYCGYIVGNPLDHTWNDATCEIAKTCSVCDTVEGDPIGHSISDWSIVREANCSVEGERAGTCERCQKNCVEKIDKLPHINGEWVLKNDFTINSDGSVTPGDEIICCIVCGEEVESREYTIELTFSQKNAAICAYDEVNFWHCGPDFLIYTVLVDFESYPVEDAKIVVDNMSVDWDMQAILYARENAQGSSRTGLIDDMYYYGFTKEQIDKALAEIGY